MTLRQKVKPLCCNATLSYALSPVTIQLRMNGLLNATGWLRDVETEPAFSTHSSIRSRVLTSLPKVTSVPWRRPLTIQEMFQTA